MSLLLVDPRAGSKDLIPYFGDQALVVQMESGDVAFAGNGPEGDLFIGVEVKKVPDLLSSEATGRLAATQLPKLYRDYQRAYLLVVGRFRAADDGSLEILGNRNFWRKHRVGNREVPYAYVESFFVELAEMGVGIRVVQSNFEAALWCMIAAKWWDKPWDKHRAMRKFDNSGPTALLPVMDPDQRQTALLAQTLPSIGYERAMAAAVTFGNPAAMWEASMVQWSEVPGVGKTLAKVAWEALHVKKR